MRPSPLAIRLYEELNSLANEFILLYGLKYSKEIETLHCPLMRWLDFRMRYIEPKPRQVIYSNRFPKPLPLEVQLARLLLEDYIRAGKDINPYQGKGLTIVNDTSGKRPNKRTDHLWASWGITHLHLTIKPIDSENYYASRSDYLAYCLCDDNKFVFLDIRPHPKACSDDFADPELIRIVYENWPQFMNQYELNGVLPGKEMEAAEINRFRKFGVGCPLVIKDKVYIEPGMGISAAGTSMKVQYFIMRIKEGVRELSELIEVGPQFKDRLLINGILNPEYRMGIAERGFVIYELKSGDVFLLNVPDFPHIELLKEHTFPNWAIKRYIESRHPNFLVVQEQLDRARNLPLNFHQHIIKDGSHII